MRICQKRYIKLSNTELGFENLNLAKRSYERVKYNLKIRKLLVICYLNIINILPN
jgi:hypothetical protein